jgi:hypothetical protein
MRQAGTGTECHVDEVLTHLARGTAACAAQNQAYAALDATTATGTASLKVDSDRGLVVPE